MFPNIFIRNFSGPQKYILFEESKEIPPQGVLLTF